jgi:hypothetical protein
MMALTYAYAYLLGLEREGVAGCLSLRSDEGLEVMDGMGVDYVSESGESEWIFVLGRNSRSYVEYISCQFLYVQLCKGNRFVS